MDQTASFKKAAETIKSIEKKLALFATSNKVCEQNAKAAENEIEECFAEILNALAARKAALLGLVHQHLNQQMKCIKDTRIKLEESLVAYNKTMEAAALMFSVNHEFAEAMHKGITNTSSANNINETQIVVELPHTLVDAIRVFGKVDITAQPQHAVNIVNKPLITEVVSTIAGLYCGYKDGHGVNAQFQNPIGVCLHNDFLYVCDKYNGAIRKVSLQGDVTTLVAQSGLVRPNAIAYHQTENTFFVTDDSADSIFKITLSGVVSRFAVYGKSEHSGNTKVFNNPRGIAIDQQTGFIYVCDQNSHTIRTITPKGEASTLAGSHGSGYADGTGTAAMFSQPKGICFDLKSKSLLVCDYANNSIRRIQLKGEVTTLCQIPSPTGISITANGDILVASIGDRKIYRIIRTADLRLEVSVIAGSGKKGRADGKPNECEFAYPTDITVHEPTHSCFVSDDGSHTIRKISFSS